MHGLLPLSPHVSKRQMDSNLAATPWLFPSMLQDRLPQDHALPGLAFLQNGGRFGQGILPLLNGAGIPPQVAGLEIMKYRPGRRLTLRLFLTDGARTEVVYAK